MADMRGRIVAGDDGLPDLAITLDAEPSGLRGYLAGANDGPGGLAGIIEAKRAEFAAAGLLIEPRYRWPLGGFPVDDGKRTPPHGDPLTGIGR